MSRLHPIALRAVRALDLLDHRLERVDLARLVGGAVLAALRQPLLAPRQHLALQLVVLLLLGVGLPARLVERLVQPLDRARERLALGLRHALHEHVRLVAALVHRAQAVLRLAVDLVPLVELPRILLAQPRRARRLAQRRHALRDGRAEVVGRPEEAARAVLVRVGRVWASVGLAQPLADAGRLDGEPRSRGWARRPRRRTRRGRRRTGLPSSWSARRRRARGGRGGRGAGSGPTRHPKLFKLAIREVEPPDLRFPKDL